MKKSIQPTCNMANTKVDPLTVRQKKTQLKRTVKTLQIFINNLDQHIADSYSKLRKNKAKNSNLQTNSKEQLCSVQNSGQKDKYQTIDNSEGELGSTLKKQSSDLVSYAQQSHFEVDKQCPTLISNDQVRKYIHFVYQTYNIPDPLAQTKRHKKLTITKSNERKNSITTISLRKKSSVSSIKQKIVMQKNIDLTPFKTLEPHVKEFNRHNTSNHSYNQQSESNRYNTTFLSAGYSSRKHQSGRKQNQKRLTETDLDNQAEVEQIFRYCFACQGHVLEKNLKFHQNICRPLQQASQKSWSQLLVILNQKIDRLTTEVQKGVVQAQPQILMSRFQNFRQAVAAWMGEIASINNKQLKISSQNSKLAEKYNEIKQQMDQSLNSQLQSISRLRWFMRLRQNLVNKLKN